MSQENTIRCPLYKECETKGLLSMNKTMTKITYSEKNYRRSFESQLKDRDY